VNAVVERDKKREQMLLLHREARCKFVIQSSSIQREQTVSFCRITSAAQFHFAARFHPQLEM